MAYFNLVGMYYHQDAFKKLTLEDGEYEGDFELEPDPDNEVDPNAIKVTCDDEILAFVAKNDTAEVKELMNAGRYYTISFCKEEDEDYIKGDLYFPEPSAQTVPALKKKNIPLMVLSIVLFLMSLLLTVAVPIVGVAGMVLAIIFFVVSRKK